MKIVTMLEFRRNPEGISRRVASGERLVLSHRGRPAARIEPLRDAVLEAGSDDPFLGIGQRAKRSAKGRTDHAAIDQILYGPA